MSATVRVSAAVMFDAAGRVLVARRPEGKHMAGFWEFPGGKIEPCEDGRQALARELREELGIELHRCHPLLELRHDYQDRVVALEVFVVDEYAGQPAALERQALQWVSIGALQRLPLLPADGPIVEAILAYEGTAHGAGHRLTGHSAR
ncbi:MAG TPA: (deoxy)nucleoside triphosphate pyrophosphohydrolase [Steroidobacteraceae bacterium]